MNKAIQGEWTGSQVLLLDYDGAARALSLSRALRDLVYKGRGPRVTKISRRTFFAVKDLGGALIDRHREPTLLQSDQPVIVHKRKRGRPTITEQMAAGKL
jgi:hypothetical protein